MIDATFPWRIAEELAARGYRDATSLYHLGDQGIKDPPLLEVIHHSLEPAALSWSEVVASLEEQGRAGG
jgi:hypothetical protein